MKIEEGEFKIKLRGIDYWWVGESFSPEGEGYGYNEEVRNRKQRIIGAVVRIAWGFETSRGHIVNIIHCLKKKNNCTEKFGRDNSLVVNVVVIDVM